MPMRKRILIVRQDRIGDVVLATPLPREIKRRWPDCRVAVLVRSYTAPLFAHDPHVDEILTDDAPASGRGPSFRRLVRDLRRRRFSHALMLLPQARINYATFCAGIPFRVGHGLILFHVLTGVRPVLTRKFRKGRHEGDYSLDLARAIGVPVLDESPELHLAPAEKAEAAAARARWRGDGGRRLVGLHVTSGRSAPNWEPERWAELARLLAADPALQVVVTDDEIPPAAAGIPGVLYPNAGAPLRRALVHLSALDVLVSASTGPMHVAAALKVPTLALFCPLPACRPELWGPRGNVARTLLPRPDYCRTACPGDPHACTFAGDSGLDPPAVARAVADFPAP